MPLLPAGTLKAILVRLRPHRGLTALRIGAIATMLILGHVEFGADAPVHRNRQFQPGQPWLDAQGTHLNAHGFCLLDHGGRHYWYGSHKIAGKTEAEKNEAGSQLAAATRTFSCRPTLRPGAPFACADPSQPISQS